MLSCIWVLLTLFGLHFGTAIISNFYHSFGAREYYLSFWYYWYFLQFFRILFLSLFYTFLCRCFYHSCSGMAGMPSWNEIVVRIAHFWQLPICYSSCRDLQKATQNFTTLIGQGAFGPVYKAQMSTGETVAVKVLASDSKQGEKEFQTEVMLRLWYLNKQVPVWVPHIRRLGRSRCRQSYP